MPKINYIGMIIGLFMILLFVICFIISIWIPDIRIDKTGLSLFVVGFSIWCISFVTNNN